MADINVDLGLDRKDIPAYFDEAPDAFVWIGGVIFLISFFVGELGFVPGFLIFGFILYWKYGPTKLSDEDIDAAWVKIAESRIDEAYRVALMEKDDTIRDAEWFFAWPNESSPSTEYKSKEGKDGFYRRNTQRLVYMIYGKDQLVTFGETICIEDMWDGEDDSQEYYWQDVSSMGFDQKSNKLELACGPKIIVYPLAGAGGDGYIEKVKTDRATEIANSVRVMLREKKSS